MISSRRGFTIVELLIVIVVIAVLAAISVIAYNGIQQRAKNTSRFNELVAWQKQFELYRALTGSYPPQPDGEYCLGTGFPTGGGGLARCHLYQGTSASSPSESASAALMTELSKVGQIPRGDRQPVGDPSPTTVGPYALYSGTSILLLAVTEATGSTCPSNMSVYVNSGGRLFCQIILNN